MGQTQAVSRSANGKFAPRLTVVPNLPASGSREIVHKLGLHEIIPEKLLEYNLMVGYVFIRNGVVLLPRPGMPRPGLIFPHSKIVNAQHTIVDRVCSDLPTVFGLTDRDYDDYAFELLGQHFYMVGGRRCLGVSVGVPLKTIPVLRPAVIAEYAWADAADMKKFPFTDSEKEVLQTARKKRLIA